MAEQQRNNRNKCITHSFCIKYPYKRLDTLIQIKSVEQNLQKSFLHFYSFCLGTQSFACTQTIPTIH